MTLKNNIGGFKRGEIKGQKLITGIRINTPSQAQARGNGKFAAYIYCGMLLLRADMQTVCLYMAPKCTLSALTEEEWGQCDPPLLISDRKKTFSQTNKNTIHHVARMRRPGTAPKGQKNKK